MESLSRLRLLMVSSIAAEVALGICVPLWIPQEYSAVHIAFFLFIGLLASASIVLLIISSTAANPDELWESWWFQYMRGIYGYRFGGRQGTLSEYIVESAVAVTNCRAFWLSAFVITGWFVWGSSIISAIVLTVMVGIGDFSAMAQRQDGGYIFISFIGTMFLGIVVTIFPFIVLKNLVIQEWIQQGAAVLWIISIGSWLIAHLILAPIYIYSFTTYVTFVGMVGGGAALATLVIWGLAKIAVRSGILVSTALGFLARSYAFSWKNQVCVVIPYKPKRRRAA